MIVFENNVRTEYQLKRARQERDASLCRIAVAILLVLALWCLAFSLQFVNARGEERLLSAELAPLTGGDLAAGRIFCSDCHREGRQ